MIKFLRSEEETINQTLVLIPGAYQSRYSWDGIIDNIQFTVVPPQYTNEDSFIHPGNITDVNVLVVLLVFDL